MEMFASPAAEWENHWWLVKLFKIVDNMIGLTNMKIQKIQTIINNMTMPAEGKPVLTLETPVGRHTSAVVLASKWGAE